MRVAIIQPWLPRYREGFYRELTQKAGKENIEVKVFFGQTPPEWVARQDQSTAEWATFLPTRRIKVGSRGLFLKDLSRLRESGPWDLIVVEQAVRNLESFLLLVRPASRRLAFWGHGKTYTEKVSGLQEKLKSWLTRRGDWFFAYTQGGREALVDSGFPENRITVVNNSTDTEGLRQEMSAISAHDVAQYQHELDLTAKTALYIGGLDRPKKIDFLLEGATYAHGIDPDFRLLIAGRGDEEWKLREFVASHPWAVYVGRVDDRQKALALKAAQVLAIPGRLGLAVVDGFATGLPTVTTEDPFHPPEFEYLEDGVNGLITSKDSGEFGVGLTRAISLPSESNDLRAGALRSSQRFSSASMAKCFVDGLVQIRTYRSISGDAGYYQDE